MDEYKTVSTVEERLAHLLRHCGKMIFYNSEPGLQQKAVARMLLEGPMTQKQIQGKLGIRAGSVSELISKLEAKDILLRQRSENDRRNVLLTLTEKGERIARAHLDDERRDMYEALSAAEREELARLLEKLAGPDRHGMHGERRGEGR